MEGKAISVRFPKVLYERLLGACGKGSVTDFIKKSVELRIDELSSGGRKVRAPVESSGRSETSQGKAGRSVMETVGRFIEENPDWLEKVPEDKQAQIVSTIGLKLAQQSVDADSEVLSLRDSLKGLPDEGDLTRELSVVKGHLFKALHERDMAIELNRRHGDPDGRREFARKVFEGVVEIVWQWIARNSMPGIGSGGGLTDSGREKVAEECRRWLERNVKIV